MQDVTPVQQVLPIPFSDSLISSSPTTPNIDIIWSPFITYQLDTKSWSIIHGQSYASCPSPPTDTMVLN